MARTPKTTLEELVSTAPHATAGLVNPIEQYVKFIEQGRQYLTPPLVHRLRTLLPDDERIFSETSSLEDLLPKLGRLVAKMHSTTIASTDTKELRDVFNASRDMIKLISTLQERIDTEKKLAQIEGAVLAACEAMEDEDFKKKFLEELERRLTD